MFHFYLFCISKEAIIPIWSKYLFCLHDFQHLNYGLMQWWQKRIMRHGRWTVFLTFYHTSRIIKIPHQLLNWNVCSTRGFEIEWNPHEVFEVAHSRDQRLFLSNFIENSLFKAITHSAIINLSKKMRLGNSLQIPLLCSSGVFFWGRGDNDLIMFFGFSSFSIELKALHGIWQIHGPIWRWLDYSGMINNESFVEPTHARKECFAWKKTHQQSAAVEEVNKKDVAVWISN